MNVDLMRQRLGWLGWRTRERQRADGLRRVWASSCGVMVGAVDEKQAEAWRIVSAAAMKITAGGVLWHLPPVRSPFSFQLLQEPGADDFDGDGWLASTLLDKPVATSDDGEKNRCHNGIAAFVRLIVEEKQLRVRLKELDAETVFIKQRLVELEQMMAD